MPCKATAARAVLSVMEEQGRQRLPSLLFFGYIRPNHAPSFPVIDYNDITLLRKGFRGPHNSQDLALRNLFGIYA